MVACRELPSRVDEREQGLLGFPAQVHSDSYQEWQRDRPKEACQPTETGKVESPSDASLKDDVITDMTAPLQGLFCW